MRYQVVTSFYASKYQEIEAESLEEALKQDESYMTFCHQCANEYDAGDAVGITVSDDTGTICHEEDWSYHPPCKVCAERDKEPSE